jgi:hypothetical protein
LAKRQLERSNTLPLIPAIKSITRGLDRLTSNETIRTFSQESIDNPSSINNYSQENMEASIGRWYSEVGWEDENIDYDEFWEDFHHLDVEVCFIF